VSRPTPYEIELGCWDSIEDDDRESGWDSDIAYFVKLAEALSPRTPDDLADIAIGDLRAAANHIPQGAQRRGAT
jgi:hypothetical protein